MRLRFAIPCLFLLSGCSEYNSWVDQRSSSFEGGEIQVPESEISVPIVLPLSEIQTVINSKIPSDLVKNKEIKAGLKLTITRGGRISLDGEDQRLDWSVPLTVDVCHSFVGSISTFKIKPVFSSELTPKDDYSLSSKTTLNKVVWVDPAVVKVLGSEIDLSNIVDDLIKDESGKITKLIDDQLSNLDLKKVLSKTWTKLSNPILVNRKIQPVYLLVNAREVILRDFSLSDHQLAIDLSVFGTISTVFDSASNVRSQLEYPPLVLGSDNEPQTKLYLPLRIDFNRINSLLEENVFGIEFTVEENNLRLDSIFLTSIDSFLLISARISGDVNAELEVLGRPQFSPSTRNLSVVGFDFQFKNISESLLEAGDYLFHDEIIEEVLTKLNIPIGSFIDSIPDLIYAGIERGKSGQNIDLNNEIDSLSFHQLLVRYDDIQLVLFATGNMGLRVEKLKKKGIRNKY
jgi:hypothetical protein